MDYKDFVSKASKAKIGRYSLLYGVKVVYDKQHHLAKVYRLNKCKKCKHAREEAVFVKFKNNPEKLSVFQVNLLFSLFYVNQKPSDYASYHKTIAGKEFIESIEEVRVKK